MSDGGSNVINLDQRRGPDAAELERLWDDFAEKKLVAERTLALADGIAAGKAYGAFLTLFEPAHLRRPLATGDA
jgi:hypothetical protein